MAAFESSNIAEVVKMHGYSIIQQKVPEHLNYSHQLSTLADNSKLLISKLLISKLLNDSLYHAQPSRRIVGPGVQKWNGAIGFLENGLDPVKTLIFVI